MHGHRSLECKIQEVLIEVFGQQVHELNQVQLRPRWFNEVIFVGLVEPTETIIDDPNSVGSEAPNLAEFLSYDQLGIN